MPKRLLLGGKAVKLVLGPQGGHWYRVGNSPALYPSVTTITGAVLNKPALIPWAKKVALENVRRVLTEFGSSTIPINFDTMRLEEAWIDEVISKSKNLPEQVAAAAADIGTRMHKAIEMMLKGQKPFSTAWVTDEDLIMPVTGFLKWWQAFDYHVEYSEARLGSHRLRVGGSTDAILRRGDGKLIVADWKSSKGIYMEMVYQLGGYALCLEEMLKEPIEEGLIIRFPKAKENSPFEDKPLKGEHFAMAKAGFAMCKCLFDISKSGIIPQWEPRAKVEKKAKTLV